MERDPVADVLTCVARGLVEIPDSVSVSTYRDAGCDTYEVEVAPADVGKVIGKHGRVASAMRLVARAAAMRTHRRVQVEFGP